jgi:phosphatidylglycerol:prolipoprotein diacylglycerol transferase
MSIPLLSIRIGIDPDMFDIGPFVLTWHGFLTFVAVALAVFLVGRWSKKEGLVPDAIYSVSTWAILGGIIGSRVAHVIDRWDFYNDDPSRIIEIWNGGITIYGALIGGFLAGAGYMVIRNHPRFLSLWNRLFRGAKLEKAPLPSVGRLADITAPALLIAMFVGRIGDIINGEHVAKVTSLPWGFVYTHPESPSHQVHGFVASHPAVVYEMILDMAVLAVIWPMRNRLRPPGMRFLLYLGLYSLGRFFISFLRTGQPPMDREWAIGLNEAQFIAIIIMALTIPLLAFKAQLVKTVQAPRAERRRSLRK